MARPTRFIEMCSRNAHLVHENPANDECVFVFDIDYCLYKNDDLLNKEVADVRSAFFAHSQLVESPDNEKIWEDSLNQFNLFRQLFHNKFGIHPKDFCDKYDLLDFGSFIKPDEELIKIFKELKFRKFCFTNGSLKRAKKILEVLQLHDVFEAVICADTEDLEMIVKPMPSAYQFVEKYIGTRNIHFFDDSFSNIKAAQDLGWKIMHVVNDIKSCILDVLAQSHHSQDPIVEAKTADLVEINQLLATDPSLSGTVAYSSEPANFE